MRQVILSFFLSLFFVLAAQTSETRTKHFNISNNLAIKGYDPVAYFKSNMAVKGQSKWALNHKGIIYYFSSDANKKLFNSNPSIYEPQYGGWCAYAMGSTGKKVDINPETFKIKDGKLYLFYNAFFNNTLTDWNKDEANLKIKADKNWANIIK